MINRSLKPMVVKNSQTNILATILLTIIIGQIMHCQINLITIKIITQYISYHMSFSCVIETLHKLDSRTFTTSAASYQSNCITRMYRQVEVLKDGHHLSRWV